MRNNLLHLISFLLGVIVCYITLQYQYFEIKKELDIPNLIVSAITIIIGFYIANTLQRRVNRNQNQQTYLVAKLDELWQRFNAFSEKLSYETKISGADIGNLNKTVIFQLSFVKNIFNSFGLDDKNACDLESKLEKLEIFLNELPVSDNFVDFSANVNEINAKVLQVNQAFTKTLQTIQSL